LHPHDLGRESSPQQCGFSDGSQQLAACDGAQHRRSASRTGGVGVVSVFSSIDQVDELARRWMQAKA
jgi:hypothetical protein